MRLAANLVGMLMGNIMPCDFGSAVGRPEQADHKWMDVNSMRDGPAGVPSLCQLPL